MVDGNIWLGTQGDSWRRGGRESLGETLISRDRFDFAISAPLYAYIYPNPIGEKVLEALILSF